MVNPPSLMEYAPPVMEIAVAALMPDTVMVFEVMSVFNETPVWSVKENWITLIPGVNASLTLYSM